MKFVFLIKNSLALTPVYSDIPFFASLFNLKMFTIIDCSGFYYSNKLLKYTSKNTLNGIDSSISQKI